MATLNLKSYRKKPIVVEAVYFGFYMEAPLIVDWVQANGGKATFGQQDYGPVEILISTLEGCMAAQIGDYIIKGAVGEFYPCKPDAFRASFEDQEA